MWETACAEMWTQKSTVFSVRVCVSPSSEGVCGCRVSGRQSSGKSGEQPPQLWASGLTEPVDCGLEGKEVLPESKGWESFWNEGAASGPQDEESADASVLGS